VAAGSTRFLAALPARRKERTMLSFIIRLAEEFQREHGMRPNLLYMNERHVAHLRDGFDERYDLSAIMNMLEMDILIDEGVVHPRVAWAPVVAAKRAV